MTPAEQRVLSAAEAWARAREGYATGPRDVLDAHRVTPTCEMRAAERRLTAAVRALRGERSPERDAREQVT